jgi:hypothetical protein
MVCGKVVALADVVRAVEVIEERDRRGLVVATRDGYEALFHPACWDDARRQSVSMRHRYRRRPMRRPGGG